MRKLLFLSALATSLAAQSLPEVRLPRAPQVTPDVKTLAAPVEKTAMEPASPRRLPSALGYEAAPAQSRSGVVPPADFLAFDEPGDGALWMAAAAWKAKLAADGLTFAPHLGSDDRSGARLRLDLQSATVGDQPLALRAGERVRRERVVTVDRGPLHERYDIAPHGVEQSFVFDALPNRGELRLQLAVDTTLRTEGGGSELRFVGERGGVSCTNAVALDARGARLPLLMQCDGKTLQLTVPATFVEAAVLPLVVDPTVSPIVFVTDTVRLSHPDIAYDPSLAEYFAVWQRDFSAFDRDVYAWRLDAGMNSIGAMQVVDVTFASWELPRVANCDFADNYLTVAQVSSGGSSPYWISARLFGPSTGMGPQFVVEAAGMPGHLIGDKLRPDVGGDPFPAAPVYYTVAWERVWSATDHDVHCKQVQTNGVLRAASPTLLDNSSAFTSRPRISNSDGAGGSAGTQFWTVAWQRTYSPTDEDIWATRITWDGQPIATGAFAVTTSTSDERDPSPSSPGFEVGGGRQSLIAWARYSPAFDWDILAVVYDGSGATVGMVDVQTLEGAPPSYQLLAQVRPVVDCDGVRFAVGYSENFVGGTNWDTRVSLLAWDNLTNSIVVQEGHVMLSATYGNEDHLALVAQGGAGGGSNYYGCIYDHDDNAGNYGIHANPYTGYANLPLPTTRLTGCGTLGITLNDLPLLGSNITFTQTDSGPLTGFVFGLPQSLPLGFCPGCELGVDGFLVGNPYTWSIPPLPAFVGFALSAQAFSLLGGPCLGSIALSNTIDFQLL